ncbi:unnamed protein product [Meloidogyne enterolobii]|uniref:Uncharacterized protein n=2 Tax=Meloidogyne enterolobii TaxID=390850 RepID=A0ACB0XND4_MELEN|nr:unnamed protein product [Meloidogyne enterolobii]
MFRRLTSIDNKYLSLFKNALEHIDSGKIGKICWLDVPREVKVFNNTGLNAVSQGKLAVILLARGQHYRFGSSLPKRIMELGLEMETGLDKKADCHLLLQVCHVSHIQQETEGNSKWMIMTDKSGWEKIRKQLDEVLEKTNLTWDQVEVFVQNENPAQDFGGKILLSSPDQSATAPGVDRSSTCKSDFARRNEEIFI